MSEVRSLQVAAGQESVSLGARPVDFAQPAGAEVLVYFDPPDLAHVQVYRREIPDGALSCALGARAAAVTMDLGFLMRIVTEGLRGGLTPPRAEIEALRAALAAADEGDGR